MTSSAARMPLQTFQFASSKVFHEPSSPSGWPGQYLDASTSAAANYRAARKGRSHDEFIAKLSVASEEADESVFWLNRFKNAGISSNAADIRPLLEEAEELAKIFGASVRTARGRRRRRRDGDPPRR